MTNIAATPSAAGTYKSQPATPNQIRNLQTPSPVDAHKDFHSSRFRTCQFVKTGGSLCQSPALTANDFCYHHQRDRLRQRNLQQARKLKAASSLPATMDDVNARILESLQIPAFDDAASIQVALSIVVQALVSNHISLRRAGLILYALHTAAANLKSVRAELQAAKGMVLSDPQPIAELVRSALGDVKQGRIPDFVPAAPPKPEPIAASL